MMISDITVWVIMSKDRTLIAKGNVRDRHLVPVDDELDKKRILTYTTKGKAAAAFKVSGFCGMELLPGFDYNYQGVNLTKYLEPVEVHMQMVSSDGIDSPPQGGWNRIHGYVGIPGGIPLVLSLGYPHYAIYDATDSTKFRVFVTNPYGIKTSRDIKVDDVSYWRLQ